MLVKDEQSLVNWIDQRYNLRIYSVWSLNNDHCPLTSPKTSPLNMLSFLQLPMMNGVWMRRRSRPHIKKQHLRFPYLLNASHCGPMPIHSFLLITVVLWAKFSAQFSSLWLVITILIWEAWGVRVIQRGGLLSAGYSCHPPHMISWTVLLPLLNTYIEPCCA